MIKDRVYVDSSFFIREIYTRSNERKGLTSTIMVIALEEHAVRVRTEFSLDLFFASFTTP